MTRRFLPEWIPNANAMKKLFSTLVFLVTFTPLIAQTGFGGGEYQLDVHEDQCLSAVDRAAIKERLRENQRELILTGKLTVSADREDVSFIWPLRKSDDFTWNSYYGISNYVDQDFTDGGLEDYHCDMRTYDGHKGTDIFTWPFPWYMYDNDFVEVVAGEAGVIIEKDDGFDDDHCECFGSWNAVYVQHEDGSVAWYGHMKKGSLTDKEIGDPVEQGEFLGIVASSGCSTGPHLHLEVYNSDVELIDPYAGACNDLNDASWWDEQPENREPTLNTILTHDEIPEHGCPGVNEDPHLQNEFYPGDVLYTAFYFHDGLAGTAADYKLIQPDGTVWNSWDQTIGTTYNASWWWWSWDLPVEGPFGVWQLEAIYEGVTITHDFNYGVHVGVEKDLADRIQIWPNPSEQGEVNLSGVDMATTVQVFDACGKLLETQTITEPTLDLAHLATGIYFLSFQLENGAPVIKKWVKR